MKSRGPKKITSRISSVTNGFVQAIIPIQKPSASDTRAALHALGIKENALACVYCGTFSTDWDHLRPLVKRKKPTGFLHEAKNLVPSCGPCNQSKGGAHWRHWIEGKAKGSPKTRGVKDLERRIRTLEKFERWGKLTEFPFEKIIGSQKWKRYWAALQEIEDKMREAQLLADEIQKAMAKRSVPKMAHSRKDHR